LLAELVAALNAFKPEMVLLYPSMASILAGEQIEGPVVSGAGSNRRTSPACRCGFTSWTTFAAILS